MATAAATGVGSATVSWVPASIQMPVVLGAIDVWDHAAAAETTLYVSSRAYTSGPNGDPPHTSFLERLVEAPTYRQDMFDALTVSGRSRAGVGTAVLNNADHLLDSWLDYSFDGRECRFWVGEASGQFPAEFIEIFRGRMLPPDADQTTIRLNLRDAQQRMSVPLQSTRFAGDNVLPDGLEGVEGDLKGKPKPVTLGTVLNVSPPCVNTARLIYQVHDAEIADIPAVYDSGLSLAPGIAAWEAKTSGFGSNSIQSAAYGNGTWVVVGTGPNIAYSTDDGETWTAATHSLTGALTGVAFGNDMFLCCGVDQDTNGLNIATSSDGITWTSHNSGSSETLRCAAYSDVLHRWVVAGDGVIKYSDDDGDTWTETAPASVSNAVFTGVVFAKNKWVVVDGRYPSSNEFVLRSANATVGSWTVDTLNYDSTNLLALDDIVFQNNTFIVCTHPAPFVFTSPDAITWTVRNVPFVEDAAGLFELAVGEGIVLAGGGAGNLPSAKLGVSYDNGVTWEAIESGITGVSNVFIAGMGYGNGRFLIGGSDGSLSMTQSAAATYASTTELLDDDEEPSPGTYKWYSGSEGSYFRLGSKPVGLVTADVVQGVLIGERTAAQIFTAVAQRAGLTTGGWSASDVVTTDNRNAAQVGYWSALKDVTCAQVADQVMGSIGGWWGADEFGVLRLGILDDPGGYMIDHTLTERDVDATAGGTTLRRIRISEQSQGVPYYQTVIGYAKNHSVQTTGLVGAVTQSRRERLAREYLEATATDSTVQAAHPLSTELRRDTLLFATADAEAESTRLQSIFGFKAEAYEFVTEFDPLDPVRIGQIVQMSNPYYALTGGRRFAVLRREIRPTSVPPSQILALWRPATITRAAAAGTATTSAVLEKIADTAVSITGVATASTTLAVQEFWGWDGATPVSDGQLPISVTTTYTPRGTSGLFSPGTGSTYRITDLTYNWNAATGAVRLGLYQNTTDTITGATLIYDHGKVTPSAGLQTYQVTGEVVVADGVYLLQVAKSDDSTMRIESLNSSSGGWTGRWVETVATENPDSDTEFSDPGTSSWVKTASRALAMGFYYYIVS